MADARSAAAALAASALIAAPTGAAPNARAARAAARAALGVAAAAALSPAEQKQADEDRAAEDDADAAADAANAAQEAAAQQQDRDEALHMDPADLAAMLRAHRAQQAQGLGLGAAPQAPPPASDLAALVLTIQAGQRQQVAMLLSQQAAAADNARAHQAIVADEARKQAAASAAQLLTLQSLGALPAFSGKGVADTTLLANDWLGEVEDHFAEKEQALGVSAAQGDRARVNSATNLLQGDAGRWFRSLPLRPATWADFRAAFEARFCSVADERLRGEKLAEFAEKQSRLRDKMNVTGLQAYTARFQQLAGEVTSDYMPLHAKLALFARGLPARLAELVMKEDSKKPPTPLEDVITIVLSRAAQREAVSAFHGAPQGASSSSASAAPIDLASVSLAASLYGWTPEEARANFDGPEGWKPHDTDAAPQFRPQGASSSSATAASSSPTAGMPAEWQQFMFNALSLKFDPNRQGNDRGNGNRSRRNAPSSITKEVPAELIAARKEAGLCMKCGIHEYTPGSQGHNSNTCRANIDKTTSAAEGKKKANFQGARR